MSCRAKDSKVVTGESLFPISIQVSLKMADVYKAFVCFSFQENKSQNSPGMPF